ncbi:MAG: response regulator [Verrucomicrobiaceae bacterium]|nr:response regulator [Verrucomicrobiaceae bacterium]
MRKCGVVNPSSPPPRVLLVEQSLPFRRVIREALTAFMHCEVDDASTGEHAFGLALQRRYALYLFAYSLPDMRGELLDRLLAVAGPKANPGTHFSPPVLYLLKAEEASHAQELGRNARVRGSLFLPPRLDTLIKAAAGILPAKAGWERGPGH